MSQKELSVHMSIYMPYQDDRSKEELEDQFHLLLEELEKKHGISFQIYDTKLQEL